MRRGETATTTRMGPLGLLVLLLLSAISLCGAKIVYPISDSHRSAALELFSPSFESLKEAYEALRTFEVLGVEINNYRSTQACQSVLNTLGSSSSDVKDVYYALRVQKILKCDAGWENIKDVTLKLQSTICGASSLFDFYFSVGSLVLIKELDIDAEVKLEDANGVFRSIKSLGQSDGRWRYNSNNPESSTRAAGIAIEALAGVVSLAPLDVDLSLIGSVKTSIAKLFESIEKYDDGALYFDEKIVDARDYQGPLSTSLSVVHGFVALADVTSEAINVPREKLLGLAKFFLCVGMPGNAHDFYSQIDSLALLERNNFSIPLILSLPSTVLSLTRKDQLKVTLNTVLGSSAPPVSVKLVQAAVSGSKDSPIINNQELRFDSASGFHVLDSLPESADVGPYEFSFRVDLPDADISNFYATGGITKVSIYLTGLTKLEGAEIAILDSDHGSIDTKNKLELAGKNSVALSANHLQKMRLSFTLSSPLGNAFKPHQVLLKLRYETNIEHVFVIGNSGKQFELILDFLELVDKLYYLSGRYDIELTVGDAVMENSFVQPLGHINLELPTTPEKAARPPPPPVDPYLRYGPKAEISHIFRAPEKRPPREVSLVFLGLTLVPLGGFLIGLLSFGVSLKGFPTSAVPAVFAILFHLGIAGVLTLYLLFWLKLNLFTTLKILGFLGVFLLFTGHRILSHLASVSAKSKSA
ncbi:Dolichyl-diphosphooligosaccharide--protein glycosyltransferase subunit 2-like protein [Drosera capensis]